jgi:hypothetical protein
MPADKAAGSPRAAGRPQKRLSAGDGPVPALAQALRELREACGNPKYRVLAVYAGVPHQRLAEAARGERLPKWEVVEGYVSGCLAYRRRGHPGGPPDDAAGELAPWRQAYRDAGGFPPGRAPHGDLAEPPAWPAPDAAGPGHRRAVPLRPRWPGPRRGRKVMLAGAAATGAALLTAAAVVSGVTLPPGNKPPPPPARTQRPGARAARPAAIVVTPPAATCGSTAANGFRSPAAAFSNATSISELSLDGLTVTTMEGAHDGAGYYWIQAHPTGRRAGIQLRWSSAPGQWHYCTATLDAGSTSALPVLVATMAVPASIHGQPVLYQSCAWHQHPYSARCAPVR